MRLAIMQPYLFPYLGYFQLIRSVDRFVVYDDVHYINRGWINRNQVLINGRAALFTVPLKQSSQNKLIKDTEISTDQDWQGKLLRKMEISYRKAPYFSDVFLLIEDLFRRTWDSIAALNLAALISVCRYLNITTDFVESSERYENGHLKGRDRIVDICKQEGAKTYVNLPGGRELYDHRFFEHAGISLRFIRSSLVPYRQFGGDFVPNLSVIDGMMFLSADELGQMLNRYELAD